MTDRRLSTQVVLHIGFEKTGTKSIQYWLRDHEDLLAEHGLRFPRGWLRLNVHQELPLAVMRENRLCGPRESGDDWRDPKWRGDVINQVFTDLHNSRGVSTVLSSENLDLLRYNNEFALLRSIVGDAHIVVYLREPIDWLYSLRDQYLNKNTTPRPLSSDVEAYNYLGPGTWRSNYDELIGNWRKWFTHVSVLNYDRAVVAHGSVVPSFLHLLGLPQVDTDYRMNTYGQPTPRDEGNRAFGLRFGQPLVQLGGSPRSTSMPSN